jgi:hypothetical protein
VYGQSENAMSLPFLDYLTPSFELHLGAEAKARSTIRIYVAAVRQFAEWIAAADPSAVSPVRRAIA